MPQKFGLVPRKRSTIEGSAARASGDHSAMSTVGSSRSSVVCSLMGHDVKNWCTMPAADRWPPGLRPPPSLQY